MLGQVPRPFYIHQGVLSKLGVSKNNPHVGLGFSLSKTFKRSLNTKRKSAKSQPTINTRENISLEFVSRQKEKKKN